MYRIIRSKRQCTEVRTYEGSMVLGANRVDNRTRIAEQRYINGLGIRGENSSTGNSTVQRYVH
jgi:hypothetical protein